MTRIKETVAMMLAVGAPALAVAQDAPGTPAVYFTPAAVTPATPDADGFLRRWLLLEPIEKPNRSNAVFTKAYVHDALTAPYFFRDSSPLCPAMVHV